MANITEKLKNILNSIYGKDVRESIHDSIKAINEEVSANTDKQNWLEKKYDEQIKNIASSEPQNAEIVDARWGFETLGSIIKKKIYHFDNIKEMKNCLTLTTGDVVETLGYYSINDGGGATYKIRNKVSEDVEDNGSINFIGSNLVAELIIENDKVNVKQFGAKGNGETDDTDSIVNAINFANNIYGNNDDIYYITDELTINNKNLYNITIKIDPFEATIGNTYFKVFNCTGNNNFTNVKVNSYFAYDPSIDIYAGETEINGIASNVEAFVITAGLTNFYKCKTNGCWAFRITDSGKVNIYDGDFKGCETSLFNSSNKEVKIYNSDFEINKQINSKYYHHIYAIQGSNTKFYNCNFTEVGEGSTGNHYHGYSPSFTSEMGVTGRLELNNCNLKTDAWCGQINGVNLIVNGGNIECSLLLTDGTLVEKPLAYFKNVTITLNANGDYNISYSQIKMENCNVIVKGTGTKRISNQQFRIYDSIFKCENGGMSLDIATATSTNIFTKELIINNCNFACKIFSWCYPIYSTNFKYSNITITLSDEKTNSNPNNRGAIGYIYNCIFNNWALPIALASNTDLKYKYIANGVEKKNISA